MSTQELLSMKVQSVMNTDLFTVQPDTILKEANIIFERELIHHLPVISDTGQFLGIISKSDILLLMDWGTKLKLPSSLRKNTFLLTSNLVQDIMESNVIVVSPEDSLGKCVQIFKENYFHALPVIDIQGKLVGLITTYDLMILAYHEIPKLEA